MSATAYTPSSFRMRPSIVLFGDSITQQAFGTTGEDGITPTGIGWASLLASSYSRRSDILNRGFSGYNTQHALDVLPRVFGSATDNDSNNSNNIDILFCTVFFGANDAALPGDPQHVPIDQYRSNLQTIVTSIRQATARKTTAPPATTCNLHSSNGGVEDQAVCNENEKSNDFPIILLTPPPVGEEMWATARNLTKSNRTNKRTHSYGSCVKQVAATLENCSVLDTWELLQGDSSPEVFEKYLSDGLHLSELGNRKVYEGLMDLIQRQYPHLAPMLDGDGKYGSIGVPLEEPLWKELCGLPL